MSGNTNPDNDPILAAYLATPEDQQAGFRDLLEGPYKEAQVVLSLQYLGFTVTTLDVRRFRQKLATGRVTW